MLSFRKRQRRYFRKLRKVALNQGSRVTRARARDHLQDHQDPSSGVRIFIISSRDSIRKDHSRILERHSSVGFRVHVTTAIRLDIRPGIVTVHQQEASRAEAMASRRDEDTVSNRAVVKVSSFRVAVTASNRGSRHRMSFLRLRGKQARFGLSRRFLRDI